MRDPWNTLLSVWVWAVVALLTVGLTIPLIILGTVLRPFDPLRHIPDEIARIWARSIIALNPFCTSKIERPRGLDRSRAYVVVSNHQSLADIVGIYLLGVPIKTVGKKSLFRIPFLGWSIAALGCIPLERGDPASIAECLRQSRAWLVRGSSIIVFAEGTRSRTGELQPFKDGAFRLSIETGAPVLPVVVDGAARLLEKGSWRFRPGARLRVTCGEPIEPPCRVEDARTRPAEVAAYRDRVRAEIEAGLARLRREEAAR
jgi:1-acyl-sn-glycerol-3-phosphate acyltransferase